MTFNFKNYRIKSYEYGFMSQRKVGNQWRIIGYYQDLRGAVKGTFQYRILNETTDNIIDAIDGASIQLQSAQLIKDIERIADEIMEGFNG